MAGGTTVATVAAVSIGCANSHGICDSCPPDARGGARGSSADNSSGSGADERLPQATDVLIIGGGIIGCSAAYYAAKIGSARVTLLERSSIGSEASSLSAGTLSCDGWGRNPSHVGWFGVLCNGSMDIFKEMEQLGHDCELRLDGALTLARTPAEIAMCQEQFASLKANDHPVEYLADHDAVVAVEPGLTGGDFMAALHSRLSGHVNSAAATKALADSATAQGARIVVGAEAIAIERYLVSSSIVC